MSMSITLHWWMLPSLFFAIALLFWWKAEHADDECFSGIGEMFAAIAYALIGLAVCVGHWL
jgi:hypothetical protein